jgi:hypothetical protein
MSTKSIGKGAMGVVFLSLKVYKVDRLDGYIDGDDQTEVSRKEAVE